MACYLHDLVTCENSALKPAVSYESVNILPVYLEIPSSWEKTIIERPSPRPAKRGEGDQQVRTG
jgi:hypothetical protein